MSEGEGRGWAGGARTGDDPTERRMGVEGETGERRRPSPGPASLAHDASLSPARTLKRQFLSCSGSCPVLIDHGPSRPINRRHPLPIRAPLHMRRPAPVTAPALSPCPPRLLHLPQHTVPPPCIRPLPREPRLERLGEPPSLLLAQSRAIALGLGRPRESDEVFGELGRSRLALPRSVHSFEDRLECEGGGTRL